MMPQEVALKAPFAPASVLPQLDDAPAPARPPVAAARRLVVKLGTRVLTEPGGELERTRIAAFAATVAGLLRAGREVVVVSSGAVGHGRRALGLERSPLRPSLRQACAAVGQSRLMDAYQRAFRPFGLSCGQLLIGQHDFDVRQRTLNLRATLSTLLHEGVVPVLNENDALAFLADAVRPVFGDNDRLAALTASETAADLLVLLTDVDGVFDRDPRRHPHARPLSRVDDPRQLPDCPAAAGTEAGRGGMKSKLEAARMAVRGGCHVVIAAGRDGAALSRVAAGDDVGTWFPARERLGSRQRWIAFASVPRGVLHLDAGALDALRGRGASLLSAGVRRVEGTFRAGDVVELRAPDGALAGRALARLGAAATRRYCKARREDRAGALIRRANIVLEDL
ncbi:MAG TPA: glutamate 5-kinase [Thermoanaerobaculia bacterium]|jgi:glutamate 5-kinase